MSFLRRSVYSCHCSFLIYTADPFCSVVPHDHPQLSGNRLARVKQAFSFPESFHHVSTLLTRDNLENSGLLLSLPSPDNTAEVQDFDIYIIFFDMVSDFDCDVDMKTL